MQKHHLKDQLYTLQQLFKWLALASVTALLVGSATAFFLLALDKATETRLQHPWLIWLLPLAGWLVGWLYHRFGQQVEAGNNLLIDEIHDPRQTVPFRMAPLVLFGTVMSHLFGGSAGREGTAVQMGGSLADQISHTLHLSAEDRRILLMAGISAGFAAVFGTPLAGTVFGLEVLVVGRMRYDALLPCLLASLLADKVVALYAVQHTHYAISAIPPLTLLAALSTLAAGAIFGLTGMLFAETTHAISRAFKRWIAYAPLRPFVGGIIIALAVYLCGTQRYAGLGIPVIVEAFQHPLSIIDALGKFAFTTLTLGAGFKGGEVTPLFFIGASLGNALAPLLHLPFPLLAGLGFVAVFAGAANTPLASMLMAIELFGGEIGLYAALACVMAYLFSGHSGIYRAQRLVDPDGPADGVRLADLARRAGDGKG